MNNPLEIEKLALERLSEAEILYDNDKFDGAFYLAGYSVELMLKAKICQTFGVPNLFDEQNTPINLSGIGDVRKALKTHNLYVLLIFSGLKVKFDTEKSGNKHLFKANSLMFGNWDENSRYKPCGFTKPKDVQELISLLKHKNGLLQWIKNS
jgi:hypothetical protein